MGRLIDGRWTTHDMSLDERGQFVRQATQFRDRIGSERFPAVPGRYHLYLSPACGWSHRVLISRALLGLEAAVPVHVADPFMGERGWVYPGGAPLLGVEPLYEIYLAAKPDYTGRVTVPVLWDTERATIVSNESYEIMAMLEGPMAPFATRSATLFPDGRRDAIDAMVRANYGPVNNGVYRAGFAGNQEAHEEAVRALFDRLDALEALLAGQRFLLGSAMTAADVCLFTTLYRFDAAYHMHFKCNLRHLYEYPSLWAYTRDIYQVEVIRPTCSMDDVKQHYYRSHESINPRRLVPLGPILDFDAPHGREALG